MSRLIYRVKPAKIKGKLIGKRVVYYGDNGEPIVNSEVPTSSTNATKNIKAVIKLGRALEKLVLFKKKS